MTFTLPIIYAKTPAERNAKRQAEIQKTIVEVKHQLDAAIFRAIAAGVSYEELPVDGMDISQASNLAQFGGTTFNDVKGAMAYAEEALLKVAVLSGGFEVVPES